MSSKNVVDLRKVAEQRAEREQIAERRRREAPPPQESRISLAQRNASLHARRRKRNAIIILVLLVLLAIATCAVSWASYLPKYSVTQVSVTGTRQVPESQVYDYIQNQLQVKGHPFFSPDNVLRFSAGALEHEIVGEFPRIASANVSRASLLATTITVTITERQPYALWCIDDTQSDCYYMDQTGFIFAQATSSNPLPSQSIATSTTATSDSTDSTSSPQAISSQASSTSQVAATTSVTNNNMYVFEGAVSTSTSAIGQTFVGAHLPGILAFLQALGQMGVTPLGATIESDDDFEVPLAQGYYLKASFGEDPQQLVQNLQLVLSSGALQGNASQLEYVDLRFGDRVYYKLKGEDQTQAPSQ